MVKVFLRHVQFLSQHIVVELLPCCLEYINVITLIEYNILVVPLVYNMIVLSLFCNVKQDVTIENNIVLCDSLTTCNDNLYQWLTTYRSFCRKACLQILIYILSTELTNCIVRTYNL